MSPARTRQRALDIAHFLCRIWRLLWKNIRRASVPRIRKRVIFLKLCRVFCGFQQKKVYLERSVKEAEDNIREMLLSRRAQ